MCVVCEWDGQSREQLARWKQEENKELRLSVACQARGGIDAALLHARRAVSFAERCIGMATALRLMSGCREAAGRQERGQ